MSHFTVLVITPYKRFDEGKITDSVDKLLAPYDEGSEVPEYDRPCYCVGREARDDVNKQSNEKFGSWDQLRADFQKVKSKTAKPYDDMTEEEKIVEMEKRDREWVEFTKTKNEFEKTAFESHILRNVPVKYCRDCSGTGVEKSTYNPKSKWDWYTVGGRWSGELHKEGKNIFKAKELTDQTFAIITPDGEWHEKGKMGWFAIVSNKNDKWPEAFDKLVEQYGENYAVLMDCHI